MTSGLRAFGPQFHDSVVAKSWFLRSDAASSCAWRRRRPPSGQRQRSEGKAGSGAYPVSVPNLPEHVRCPANASSWLTGVIVGELIGAEHGIGRMIIEAEARGEAAGMMVAVFVLMIAGVILSTLVRHLQAYLLRWRPAQQLSG